MFSYRSVWSLSSVEATKDATVIKNRINTLKTTIWDPVEYGKCDIHYDVNLCAGD